MKKISNYLLFIFFLIGFQEILAQEKNITGVVTDESNVPLPGVNVMVKGTNTGTQTDFDGNYSIEAEPGEILVFSFIGTKTIELVVSDSANYNVQLEESAADLDEVVVVGYGTSKVKDVTGSISRISEESFNRGVIASPDQLVQGKVSGVNIVNNSGAPGGEVSFRIRGASSVRSGNQPLFVVDGVPLDGRDTKPSSQAPNGGLGNSAGSNPLNFINPNDIETIDILKDASATAIYGSRGSSGVVIITTKRGSTGVPTVKVDLSSAISTFNRKPDIMNGDTYRRALEARGIEDNNGGTSVDAFDEIMQTAVSKTADFSISGGKDGNVYRFSAGYLDQQGIVKESGIKKYTANYSSTYRFFKNDRLKLDLNLIASNTIENGAPIAEDSNVNGSLIGNAVEWNPTVPFYNSNGDFVQRRYQENGADVAGLPTNPLALIEYYNDESNISNILGNVGVTFKILDNLEYKLSLGVNHSKGNRATDLSGRLFLDLITDRGVAMVSNSILSSSTLTHILNYREEFGDLNLNALVGYEFQDYKRYQNSINATGFTSFEVLGSDILQNPSKDNVSVNSFRDPTNQLQSYFGRLNLNFSDRYLLTATMRADGSTKFGENNKYGYFPSFAGAWTISEEDFLKDNTTINNLKLRMGWGQTGNQEFPTGASQERYSFGTEQISLENVANPDLKWETSETYNLGLDFSLFEDKLSGSLEYFDKTTKDLLFLLPAIQPAPSAQFWTNLPAEIKNSGFEVMLNTVLTQTSDFNWEVGVNGTYLKNRLENYNGADVLTGQINGNGLGAGSTAQLLTNNQPLFVYNMLEFQGLDESGLATYSEDREFVGDPNPDFLMGINTNLRYRKFDFNMSFNGVFGHQVYNNTANAVITAANFGIGRNASPEIGLGNESLSNANVVSTRYLEDADFLRLQNASLGYNIGKISEAFTNTRISLTGQNLLLITNYSGFDPEVNTSRGIGGVPSFGIDYITYPPATTISLGFSTTF